MIFNSVSDNVIGSICIIGTGIGGATLARCLKQQNVPFIIVEAGSMSGNSDNVNYENIGRNFGVRTTTTIQVGGTSNLWHGVLSPLDKVDFEYRPWVKHSGWPISIEDLKPYYKQASKFLNLNNFDYYELNNLNENFKKQISSLKINRKALKNKIFQQPVPPKNFKNDIVEICDNSKNFHCYHSSPIVELIREGEMIRKVKVGNKDGTFSFIIADIFIVCTGALETPRLLLNSNFKNKNIGKYLMDHPMGNLCQVELKEPAKYPIYTDTKIDKKTKIKSGFEFKESIQQKHGLPNHNFYLRPSFIKGIDDESEKIKIALLSFRDGKFRWKDLWKLICNPNVVRQIIAYKFSVGVTLKYADLFFVTEQLPNPNSTVSLSTKLDKWGYQISKVDWQVLEQDIEKMKLCFKLIHSEFFPAENYNFTHNLDDFNWKKTFTSAIHHVGTARMGENDNEGVVDKNLKVYGTSNLYICDGSIFRTAGNVNNGLTISAFSCRLASYLKDKV